jgi:hypothetical protein
MTRRAFALLPLFACVSFAAVTSVEVIQRTAVLDGAPFGSAGAYERIVGKAHFAVDPKLAANRIIADIDLAPRNAEGKVEFAADLYILRPRDPGRGNGTALVEISNRGGKAMLNTFNLASGSTDPRSQSEFGDNFVLQQGYTLVWIGWEFDIPPGVDLLHLYAPIAIKNGLPITGVVRSEWEGHERVETISLGDRNQVAYPVADERAPENKMYVRDSVAGERRAIPRDKWKFTDERHVTLEGGFAPGKIYEVVYLAKDPALVGLGPTAVRDLVSFLKYGGVDTALGDEHPSTKRALGFGISQSGRFLRAYLYDGFNQDEKRQRLSLRPAGAAACDAGLAQGRTEPPPSKYPRVAKDQLVSLGALAFPNIEGVQVPRIKREAYRWTSRGTPQGGRRLSDAAPASGSGRERNRRDQDAGSGGAPGTHTGWNLRAQGHRRAG